MRTTKIRKAPGLLSLVLAAAPAFAHDGALAFLSHPDRGRYQLNVDEGFAGENIQRGYGLLREILDGEYDLLTDRRTDGLDVVAVLWSLYDAAARKGQAYEQGSFMVEDRDGYLFQFLAGNHEAGQRHSSHLHRASRITQAGHFGIDILGAYEPNARVWTPHSEERPNFAQQNILPARKGTVLFIPMAADPRIGLAARHVFIKMEDHGLRTWHGYLNHAWDFVTGTLLKLNAGGEGARKERIDPEFTGAYRRMVDALQDGHRARLHPHAAELGLRVMRAQAAAVLAMPAGERAHLEAGAFLALVEARGLDHLDVRTGSEVVFSENELRQAAAAHGPADRGRKASPDWVVDMPGDLAEVHTPARLPAPKAQGLLDAVWSWMGW